MSDGAFGASSAFRREALELAEELYDFACHLSGSAAEAEELVQEAYARAFAASEQYARGTNLKAWMMRIARNAWYDARRRASRSPFQPQLPSLDALDETAFPFGGEDHDVPRSLAAHDLERALAALPAERRELVLLDWKGFTETDLAHILGIPVGTVKSRLARARAALRAQLAGYQR